jgi:hypothetical protein
LISARQRAGKTGLDADLLAGVQSSRSSTVRARSTLAMVRGLRAYHDPAWENIASQWLAAEGTAHSIVATEIRKLLGAKLRLAADGPGLENRAAQLLSAPELLSRNEYVAAVKGYVRDALASGLSLDLAARVSKAVQLYGQPAQNIVAHSIALAALRKGRHDVARPLLESVVVSYLGKSFVGFSPNGAVVKQVLGGRRTLSTLCE